MTKLTKFPDEKLGVIYPAIADGWKWSVIYNSPKEIALIWGSDDMCKAKVIDGIATMNPSSDDWDKNIVEQIVRANLSFK